MEQEAARIREETARLIEKVQQTGGVLRLRPPAKQRAANCRSTRPSSRWIWRSSAFGRGWMRRPETAWWRTSFGISDRRGRKTR